MLLEGHWIIHELAVLIIQIYTELPYHSLFLCVMLQAYIILIRPNPLKSFQLSLFLILLFCLSVLQKQLATNSPNKLGLVCSQL